MARLPCSIGPHLTPFRNRLAYSHVWGNGTQTDSRHRLCPEHFPLIDNDLLKYEWDSTETAVDGIRMATECFACLKPVDQTGLYVSVTSYPSNNERKDYSARIHIDCSLPEWMLSRDES
jgi:hypothetical protein